MQRVFRAYEMRQTQIWVTIMFSKMPPLIVNAAYATGDSLIKVILITISYIYKRIIVYITKGFPSLMRLSNVSRAALVGICLSKFPTRAI